MTKEQRAAKLTGKVVREATAWELIGWDDGFIRIKGGRAIYEAVMSNCSHDGRLVKLARLDAAIREDGAPCIKETSRYVHPETVIEVLEQRC